MSQENVEIVRRFLIVVDVDEALTYADPGIVWNPIEELPTQGHDAVRESLARCRRDVVRSPQIGLSPERSRQTSTAERGPVECCRALGRG